MKKKRFLALLLSFALMIPTVGVSAEGYEPSRTEISVEEVQTDEPVVDEPVIDEPEAGIPAQESTVPTEEDVSSELTLFGDYADDTMELAWGECGDNLTWSLVVDLDYTLIISGTGEMYDYTADSQPWDDYKDDISEVVVEDGVTSVGGYAFYTYSGLTSVSLPDELAEIGDMAFCGTGLTEVTVPASVTYIGGDAFAASALETVTMLCSPSSWDLAFEECLSLTEVVLPDHMTSISYGAFHICTALTEITIPSAMEHISESAFGMCYNLENVYYNGTEEEWNEITIGENNEYLTGATIHFTEAEVSAELMLQFSSVSIEAGDEASFDEFTIMSSDGFTSGDKLTLTLSDGFSFAEEQTLIDGDTEITYKWIDDTELQVTVPEDPGDGFDLNGLTILAEDGLNDGDEAKIIVSGEGYVSDTATVAFVGEGGTEVNDFLELYVEEPRQIIPGGTAVFDSMLLIKDTAFSESDVITFTLNEGFTFVEGMTITDVGNPITILEVDGDTLVIQAPSDIDGEFGLDGLTIAADADVAVGTRIYLTASMDGYGEAKDRIGRVVDEITDEIWLRFEEIDLTAGETTAFEDFCIMKYFEFDPGEAVTLTLSEGFYFPVSQTMMDGDTQIDYALSNDREMVIYAPQFPGNGFDLVGLTIGTESGVERRTEVTLTVTVEGCEAIEEEVGMVTTAAAGNVLYLDVDPVKIKAGGMASFETLGVDKDEEFTAGDKVTLTLNEGFSFQENDVYHDHNGNIIERFSWSEKEIVVLAPEDPGFGFDLEELTIIADKDVAVGTKARMTASMDGYEPTTETAATVIDGAAVISGTCGPNLTWTYDPDTDTLTITGIGAMYDYIFNGGGHDVPIAVANEIIAFEATSEAPWADYRTDITAVTVEEGVTSIGDYAFAGCSNLEEVTLPNSLTDIGDGAFYGCSSLTDVYYSGTEAEWAAVSKGANNETVTSADIHLQEAEAEIIASGTCGDDLTWELTDDGTLTISGTGDMDADYSTYAPWSDYAEDITSVVIEDGVTSIGSFAFLDCNNLREVTISDSVTSMGQGAFMSCNALEDITLSDGLTSISDQIFQDCEALTEITIPDGVTSIGAYAFAYCSSLAAVTIPDHVTSIEEAAFGACHALTEITIPVSVTTIGDTVFWDCTALTDVYYGGSEAEWNEISIGVNNEPLLNANIAFAISNPSGTCGENLTWELDAETGILTISGTGDMADGTAPWSDYAEDITSVVIEEGVTSIGDDAFSGCAALTQISIPSSVKNIGRYAFYDCSALKTIDIPEGVTTIEAYAFYLCDGLEKVSIPNTMKTIEGCAFSGCTALAEINLPDGINSIGGLAFYGCESLTKISVPAGVTAIEANTFKNCTSLTEISIPSGVTAIGDDAFAYCPLTDVYYDGTEAEWGNVSKGKNVETDLNSATIHFVEPEIIDSGKCGDDLTWTLDENGLLTISGTGAMYDYGNFSIWYGNTQITSVYIEEGVTTVGSYAFNACTNLTEVTFPETLVSIGENAFNACSKLTEIDLPDGVTSIGKEAFRYCTGLASVGWSENLTTIGEGAFKYCYGLTSVVLPDSVTSIGMSAFYQCTNLTTVVLPEGLTEISGEAFSTCEKMESITIPASVKTIVNSAFYNCPALTDVYYGSTEFIWNKISIGNNNENLTNATIHFTDLCAEGHTEVIVAGKEATCTETGLTESRYCEVCGEVIAVQTEIPAKGHTVTNGICTVCKLYGTCGDNLAWTFDEENGTLTISGTGNMYDYDYYSNLTPWNEYKDEILSITAEKGVTSISSYAFYNYKNLKEISLPDSLTSIGYGTFYNCSNLKEAIIPAAVTNMYYAFQFAGLEKVTLLGEPVSWEGAFAYCSSLTTVILPEGMTTVAGAFINCSSLTEINIPDSVTTIAGSAFSGCSSLKTIELPDSLTTIGTYAFSGCPLTEIDLPEGLTTIGDGAFYHTELTSVTIPASVTSISGTAFANCTSLTDITVANGNTTYTAKDGALLSADGSKLIYYAAGRSEVELPESVTVIGQNAFNGKTKYTEIHLPEGITTIQSQALYDLKNVTEITIPETVTSLSAVSSCSALKKLDVRSAVTQFDGPVVSYCQNLTELLLPKTLTVLNLEYEYDMPFRDCGSLTSLHVPYRVSELEIGSSMDDYSSFTLYFCTEEPPDYVDDHSDITTCNIVICYPDSVYSSDSYKWERTFNEDFYTFSTWDHSTAMTKTETVEPTCGSWGYDVLTCRFCDTTEKDYGYYYPTGHSYQETVAEKYLKTAATCTGNAVYYQSCSVCDEYGDEDYIFEAENSALGHTEVTVPGKPATDTETGLTDGIVCDVCGETLKYQEMIGIKIPAEYYRTFRSVYVHRDTYNYVSADVFVTEAFAEAYPDLKPRFTSIANDTHGTFTDFRTTEKMREIAVVGGEIFAYTRDEYGSENFDLTLSFGSEYEPVPVEVSLVLVNKIPVTIGGLTAIPESVYDGTQKFGFDGTPTFTREDTGEKMNLVNADLTSVYYVKGEEGTYSQMDDIPTAEGEYKVTVSVDNGYYYGSVTYTFTVLSRCVNGHNYTSAVTKEATCTEAGIRTYTCQNDASHTYTEEIPKTGHTEVTDAAVEPTCEGTGLTEGKHCDICDAVTVPQTIIPATGHDYTSEVTEEATCTDAGIRTYTCRNDASHTYTEVIPETGHTEVTLPYVAPTTTSTGLTEGKKCDICDTVTVPQTVIPALTGMEEVSRVYGLSRCDTAMKAADTLKEVMEIDQFDTVIVANAQNFADALGGSYLAAVKDAPILMTNAQSEANVKNYIRNNLKTGGTIYILGGPLAVASSFETGMDDFNINRLYGTSRYDTNLEILKEAGVNRGSEVLVCTGTNFADSLSASATGKPILMVGNSLTANQKDYLNSLKAEYTIIGGPLAVNANVEAELNELGDAGRIYGTSRFDTSVVVAQQFFRSPEAMVLAYAQNFPDGLSGGPLAYQVNGPLVLTQNGKHGAAMTYAKENNISGGYVMGGSMLISDDTAKAIFDVDSIGIK